MLSQRLYRKALEWGAQRRCNCGRSSFFLQMYWPAPVALRDGAHHLRMRRMPCAAMLRWRINPDHRNLVWQVPVSISAPHKPAASTAPLWRWARAPTLSQPPPRVRPGLVRLCQTVCGSAHRCPRSRHERALGSDRPPVSGPCASAPPAPGLTPSVQFSGSGCDRRARAPVFIDQASELHADG